MGGAVLNPSQHLGGAVLWAGTGSVPQFTAFKRISSQTGETEAVLGTAQGEDVL